MTGHKVGTPENMAIMRDDCAMVEIMRIHADQGAKYDQRRREEAQAILETHQNTYNLLNQYATWDLARNMYGSYKVMERRTLAQIILEGRSNRVSSEEQQEIVMNLWRNLRPNPIQKIA